MEYGIILLVIVVVIGACLVDRPNGLSDQRTRRYRERQAQTTYERTSDDPGRFFLG